MKQEQFLDVVSRDEAERRFHAAIALDPLEAESCALAAALGRVLAADVRARLDVPGFSRANVDGFALRAADTYGAAEETPASLTLNGEVVPTGVQPQIEVAAATATQVATGAIVPRGADAVIMVEHTDTDGRNLLVRRPVVPGAHVAHAGSDIARGEVVLRTGEVLTSRGTGILAALGIDEIQVVRRPRVAVVSTGDEVVAPGKPLQDGFVYDSNGRIVADAVREAGGEPVDLGIVGDDEQALQQMLARALKEADLVVYSGGTSKGAGDLSYRILRERGNILVHGVALKPGKPVVLAEVDGKPVVILPGFPTSAIFTFHEFVAPVIRARAGLPPHARPSVRARLPRPVASERGRTEYDLVHLVRTGEELTCYPLGKGSGSVTTFSHADGFYVIPAATERLEAGDEVEVTLLGPLEPPDLVVIGSHCTGLDLLLGLLRRRGYTSKVIAVGSQAGLDAAKRGECDIAGVHLFDADSGVYNEPFVDAGLELVRGYGRKQGIVSRDGKRAGRMVNRNRGSGTRALIDQLLEEGGERPPGYEMEVRSHNAVAAAVASGRADWGVCIQNLAGDLHFEPLQEERFDFVIPKARADGAALRAFRELLAEDETRRLLQEAGFQA